MRTREAVLYEADEQRRAALVSRRRVAHVAGEAVTTEVIPVGTFHPAEPMNQKANLQRLAPDLVRQLAARAGGRELFLASPAAAHLNAYAGGFAGDEAIDAAARELGLPAAELASRIPR
jgi:hypothetical protein